MKFITAFVVATVTVLFTAPPALAQGQGPPPHESIYDGLLPEGFVVRPSARPLDGVAMREQRAALIPSANFNEFTDRIAAYWARMDRNVFVAMAGVNTENSQSHRDAGDPRVVSDRVVDALRPCFASVFVASDIAAANEQGADVFVIVDYWGGFRGMGYRYYTRAGVAVLDQDLAEQFATQHDGVVPREQARGFAPSNTAVFQAEANTVIAGLNAVADPTLADVRARICSVS